jgi:DNA-binding PadR family transcriptional regulator
MEPPVTTRVALLQALRDGPGFGQDLIRRIARMTGQEVRLSAPRVYPCLHSLQREGLVSARTVVPGKKRGARSRTYYELTPLGVEVSSGHRRVLEAIVHRAPKRDEADGARMSERLLAADELSASAMRLREAMRPSETRGPN